MNLKERFLSVFSDERKNLDRVPTFVQHLLDGFIMKNEAALFDIWKGDFTYNVAFDSAMCMGFDSAFASLPTDNIEAMRKTQDHYERISDIFFPLVGVGGGLFDSMYNQDYTIFSYHYCKRTKYYRETLKNLAENVKKVVENIIEALGDRPGIICLKDDVAFKGKPMLSPDRFRQDMGKYYKEINKMIHDAGMHTLLHTDGDVTDMVPAFQEAGFEGVQAWEGGADPFEIVEKYPEFVTVGWGDVSYVLPFGTEKEIEDHVKYIMDAAKENRHLVAGPSTVIYEKIPIENVRYFMKCIKKHGNY
ncbi:MAG: uroporphyrinogen decarboxylase family protein [Candidatus Hodarchaeota archaeon]